MFAGSEKRPDRCEVCKFSIRETRYAYSNSFAQCKSPDTIEVYVCKRVPPTPNERGYGVSPVVSASDYCGEFVAKETA